MSIGGRQMIEKEREKAGQKSWNEVKIIAAIKGRVGMHCEGHILKVDRYQVWGAAPLNAPLHTLLTCRFRKSKRNPPTVVLVRVRASSMMVETPKSPVDIKLQYDQKYFNNLGFFLANFKFLGFKMTDLPTEILPSSARKMLLGLRSLSKFQQTQKGKIIIRISIIQFLNLQAIKEMQW